MLIGYRYLLAFTPEQADYAEKIAATCRSVWNTGLEQRRAYRLRGSFINYFEQCKQLTDARSEISWLADVPRVALNQTLRDLDLACRTHGTWKVHWRSRSRWVPAFRLPEGDEMHVRQLNRRWGCVNLPKMGVVRFRMTRTIRGSIRNATVLKDGGKWYVSFCVEDGVVSVDLNGKAPVGVDRGVAVAVATSDGEMRDREFVSPGEAKRFKRLQRQLSRQRKGSNRRAATKAKFGSLNKRIRDRRTDFCAWTANRLTADHGTVVIEALKIVNMTKSAKGTIETPGARGRQKAGLNRTILAKGWGKLALQLEHKARYNGSQIVKINPANTSQTCHECKHVDPKSRDSQAVFRCTACGHQAHADVNAARNILAAGLAVTGRGDLGVTRSAKRQPPERESSQCGVDVNAGRT